MGNARSKKLSMGEQMVVKAHLIGHQMHNAPLLISYQRMLKPPPPFAAVDSLQSPRPPQPSLDAIYLLTPTTQNVDRVIADFANGRRTYRHVHLYFIDGLSDSLADKLTRSLPEEVLKSFVELYCNFWRECLRTSFVFCLFFFSPFSSLLFRIATGFCCLSCVIQV